jgi:SOS response regulatory protein OraA/RecX
MNKHKNKNLQLDCLIKKEYTKLDKKYNDKNIIKTKLYQKGYSLENIDKIMKKDSN